MRAEMEEAFRKAEADRSKLDSEIIDWRARL